MAYSADFEFSNWSHSHIFNWQVAKLSLQTGFTSEYTRMVLFEDDHLKKVKEKAGEKVCTVQRVFIYFNCAITTVLCFNHIVKIYLKPFQISSFGCIINRHPGKPSRE